MNLNFTEIEEFLSFTRKLNSIVSINGSDFVLVALNNFPMPKDFISRVDDMCDNAICIFSLALSQGKFNSEFFQILRKRIKDRLDCFCYENENLNHSNLHIVDRHNRKLNYDDLPDSLKKELSGLIEVVKKALTHFENTISELDPEKPCVLKYKGSKIDLVTEAVILYESELFDIDKSKVSRNDFVRQFARNVGVHIDNPAKTIDKIKNKSNPVEYLDDLRKIGEDFFLD